MIGGLILGVENLFFAVQLLYINLITDGAPALALAFAPKEEDMMKQPPNKMQKLLERKDLSYIFLVGIIASIIVISSYFIFNGSDILRGKAAAFSVLALIQSFIFVNLWLSHKSIFKNLHRLKSGFFILAFITPFILQFIIVQNRVLAGVFKVTVVSFETFGVFVLLAALVLPVVSLVNRVFRETSRF